jgi:RNA polymerase sigma-70 factor (ECF subfamily)
MTAHPSAPDAEERTWATFEAIALPHVERLFRLAIWWVRSRPDAEDIVQDTMMEALKSFHRFQPGTNCRAWLVTILQHVISNRRRAGRRSPIVSDSDGRLMEAVPFVPPVPEHISNDEILDALRNIPEPYQQVILLSDVQELTYKEIAEALAVPIGTVMSRLHRGRALLRSQLKSLSTPVVQERHQS